MTSDLPRLETPRLELRPLELHDFDAYAELVADDEAMRFLGGPQPRSVAWRGFMTMAGAWHLVGFSMFSVIVKHTGEWIGRVGPWMPEGWPGTEVGWGIAAAHWRRGYATEAAVASMDWAFATLGWTEVIHSIDPRNTASVALAERLVLPRQGASARAVRVARHRHMGPDSRGMGRIAPEGCGAALALLAGR